MCIGRVIEETGFFSIPSPPLTLIPWTELNPNTVPDFPCHPLLASRKTPDIHDYIIVAFPPCPEAGSIFFQMRSHSQVLDGHVFGRPPVNSLQVATSI